MASSSATQPSVLSTLFIIFCLYSFSFARANVGEVSHIQSQYLAVPASKFMSSLANAIDAVRNVTSIVSRFSSYLGDFRLSNAISDCLELLDFSADELSWSLSTTQNPNGKTYATGDMGDDLRTWLAAVLTNSDTCIDGFEGTNSIIIRGIVERSLSLVTSMVSDLLRMVHLPSEPTSNSTSHRKGKLERKLSGDDHNRFPPWAKSEDRKLLQVDGVNADVVVSADGRGNFTTIMEALKAVPDYSMRRFVIYVKRGVYKENVEIGKKKWSVTMVGDGMDATVISGNRSYVDGWTTFRSATFAVTGNGFMARDLTIENTAGPEKHQAVALRSDSEMSIFLRCGIRGYQDTLYTRSLRQFYRECRISGTVDFIFGDATTVLQNCQILAKRGLPNQKNTITAQGRKDPYRPSGLSMQFCNFTADLDLLPFLNSTQTYLGRPWKLYSRTVIMQSYMSDIIKPEGWLEWNRSFALDTLYYAEYMNYGPGSGLDKRVKWLGYHVLNKTAEASKFTVAQFIKGTLWLPSRRVTYVAGL